MRRRLLSVPLALCMLLALLSGTALAADETGGNYYHWDFTKQSDYVFGLEENGTTSTKEPVRIRSASHSPHWKQRKGRPWPPDAQSGTWDRNPTKTRRSAQPSAGTAGHTDCREPSP